MNSSFVASLALSFRHWTKLSRFFQPNFFLPTQHNATAYLTFERANDAVGEKERKRTRDIQI